jgi:hypothetical protein
MGRSVAKFDQTRGGFSGNDGGRARSIPRKNPLHISHLLPLLTNSAGNTVVSSDTSIDDTIVQ